MSLEENKIIARRFVEDIWDKGDFAAERELIASNVILHNVPPGIAPGFQGHHQILVMMHNAFEGGVILEDVIAEGDRVVDRWTFHGTHRGEFFGIPATGKQITCSGMDINRIENGQIVEHWHQEDFLGVIPAPEPNS